MIKVTCAIIQFENRILVTQHGADTEHAFLWEFPGGKIKTGETADHCIRREIMEELELEIEILKEMVPVTFDYGFREIELIPFFCSVKTDKIVLNNHIGYKWVKWSELQMTDFLEADRKLLQQEQNWQFLKEYFREKMDESG